MSVIAVRKYPNKIVISADYQTSWGEAKLVDANSSLLTEPSKIWQHNDLVIGSAGYNYQSNLLRLFSRTRKPRSADVEAILDYLMEFSEWAQDKSPGFDFENHLIIIFEGKVFQTINHDVREVREYSAVGSGMFLAIGAMYMGAGPKKAVEVAKQFDLYCSGETETIKIRLED